MNPKRIKRSVLPLIVVSFLAMISMNGCKNATSANMTGTFGGRVLLFDSTHTALSDCSGVTVQLDGTALKTTTDSLGNWTIGIVPEGAYNITATKSGYGTYRWFHQTIECGNYGFCTVDLARISSEIPTLDSVWADSRGFGCVGHLHSALQTTIGYCDTVSSLSPDESHVLVSQYGYFSLDALRKKGVRSGQALYISISGAFNEVDGRIGGPELSYFDPEHEETRWATTGPKSNVIEVRMP